MHLLQYQVDAFSDKPFQGNPAAVCPLSEWLPDPLMQALANENNLSETAFLYLPEAISTCAGLPRPVKSICVAMPHWQARTYCFTT